MPCLSRVFRSSGWDAAAKQETPMWSSHGKRDAIDRIESLRSLQPGDMNNRGTLRLFTNLSAQSMGGLFRQFPTLPESKPAKWCSTCPSPSGSYGPWPLHARDNLNDPWLSPDNAPLSLTSKSWGPFGLEAQGILAWPRAGATVGSRAVLNSPLARLRQTVAGEDSLVVWGGATALTGRGPFIILPDSGALPSTLIWPFFFAWTG